MKKLIYLFLIVGIFVFSNCTKETKEPIGQKTKPDEIDLSKLLPQQEDFAAEPLLVYLRDKIETKNFDEFKKSTLSSQPEQRQKVIKMILDEIEKLDFKKSLTGVYVEHSNNVTFSIVYFLFGDEKNASLAIPKLEMLYTELIGQNFKELKDNRVLGDDQKIIYTIYQSIPVYFGFYRRGNIVVMLFVPTKAVFPRVFPVSSINFPLSKEYYFYQGLPDFAQVEKPNIAELKVPTDDYFIPNTSTLREMAEERSKLWMNYFSKYSKHAKQVAQEFFNLSEKRLMDFALAYVDFRYSENLIPQKYPKWYESEVDKKIGDNIRVELISTKPSQPRYKKIHYEGGVRYQYPKLGMCEYEFRVSGSKSTRRVKITFSTFGKYLKIVDIKIA
ncbi:MAG: hypothetical protein N3F03_01015 [Ignavibacteria bacterium]|nr:hypothetical protein [Ignavibacteria bacterium]